MKRFAGLVLLLVVGRIVSSPVHAQTPHEAILAAAEASFPEPFSSLTGLRELSDGRLIVSDRIEQFVGFIDLMTGTRQPVGRVGEGPGEYRMPGRLLPLPGDSTMLIDLGNTRMTVIGPNGRMVRSVQLMRPDGQLVRPIWSDTSGGLYFEASSPWVHGPADPLSGPPLDSIPVARWDVVSGAMDTLFHLSARGRERMRQRYGEANLRRLFPPAFATQDAWSVSSAGRIAMVYADPYHVVWQTRNGTRIVGPTIEYDPIPVTRGEKEAWAESVGSSSVLAISGEPEGGSRTQRLPLPDLDEISWPDVKPPFAGELVKAAPDGELWVGRYVRVGEPQAFDVIDAGGNRVRTVVLPEGRRLVGFGNRTLYAVYSDDNDLQWLERYAR